MSGNIIVYNMQTHAIELLQVEWQILAEYMSLVSSRIRIIASSDVRL